MDAEIKIDANLTKMLELLCERIGVTTKEIIPSYARAGRMRAIGGIIRGLLSVSLPWILFLIVIPIRQDGYDGYGFIKSPEGWEALWMIVKLIVCGVFTAGGISDLTNYFEEMYASKGCAIERLINQLTD